jgi:hypothetical protein
VIENLRGRSAETKYGRIPLWLYGSGISLQAIATYGWLHGRYGHFERVIPSYATLARELGVSRGSVIAYVKELTGVGAVRVVTSGAPGQTTNTYEIAFNEPFPTPDIQVGGGQNPDQVVSRLHRGGQPADQGGQPVVQEEDVPKKTKKTLSSRSPQQPRLPSPRGGAPEEREISAAPDNPDPAALVADAWQVARGGRRNPTAQRAVAASAAELLAADWTLPEVTALAEDMARVQPSWRDLGRHADHWQPPTAQAAPGAPGTTLPAWCGSCGDGDPVAAHNPNFRLTLRPDGTAVPCAACHPSARPAAA